MSDLLSIYLYGIPVVLTLTIAAHAYEDVECDGKEIVIAIVWPLFIPFVSGELLGKLAKKLAGKP